MAQQPSDTIPLRFAQTKEEKMAMSTEFLDAAVETAKPTLLNLENRAGLDYHQYKFFQSISILLHLENGQELDYDQCDFFESIKRKREFQAQREQVCRFFKKPKQSQDLTMHSSFIQKTLREGRRQIALPTNPALLPDSLTPTAFSATQAKYVSELLIQGTYAESSPIKQCLKAAYNYERISNPAMFTYARKALLMQNEENSTFLRKSLSKYDSTNVLTFDKQTNVVIKTVASKCDIYTVQVPAGVKEIGSRAFHLCNRLQKVVLPESITNIAESAFRWCISLRFVSISQGANELGDMAFDGNLSLQKLVVPESVTSLGKSVFRLCISLTYVRLPDSLTSIPDEAFQYCVNLTDVVLPTSVVNIGNHSFAHCVSLPNLWLPDSVETIDDHAFQACVKFSELKLPFRGKIGKNVFFECHKLKSVVYRPVSSPVFVVWALGQSRNRDNWQLTTIQYLRNLLRQITDYTVERNVFEFDSKQLSPCNVSRGEERKLIAIVLP